MLKSATITATPHCQTNNPKLTTQNKAKIVKKSETMKLAGSLKTPKEIDIDCIRDYVNYSDI